MTDARSNALMPSPSIDLFLVSHTNVGKTTLIRTLLGKDVGEVFDSPDVTKALASYDLVTDPALGSLRLWDTPGFGDSFQLSKRLKRNNWVASTLRALWDRPFEPSLWRGQRLVIELKARASVILYPVNLLERPVDAIYVAPELEILASVGKPVLVILNQGSTLEAQEEAERVRQWREHLAGYPVVRRVVSLDAYTRCWLQELLLFNEIGQLLSEADQSTYAGLAAALGRNYAERFDQSAAVIADDLLRLASDQVVLETGWFESLKDVFKTLRTRIPWGHSSDMLPVELGMQGLAQRYAEGTKATADKLIALHGLDGVSAAEVMQGAADKLAVDKPVDTSSAVTGGVVSGILTGLSADLMTGGLTLGTGALIGGVMGGFGAAALAKGYNVYAHKGQKMVRWSAGSLQEALAKSVLLYLAVAHFGRGQGQWRRKQDPASWAAAVNAALAPQQERFHAILEAMAVAPGGATPHANVRADACAGARGELESVVRGVLQDVLLRLYPDAAACMPAPIGALVRLPPKNPDLELKP
jgi:Domain of unknown function (DUF3482)/50S ribosome-binding GTPase